MNDRQRRPAAGAAAGRGSASTGTNEAWIFASLVANDRTTLKELLWRADAINHLIPTAAELRSALRELHARGLIVLRGQGIRLTARGGAVHATAARRRGGLFSFVRNVAAALRSSPFRRPAPSRPDLAFVTAATVQRAYDEYAADAARSSRRADAR